MRTVFFGTSAFAVPSLHVLAARTACGLVVTQPDRPAGRGQRLRPTPVKAAAQELGIPTIEPERLRRENVPELLAEPFDFFVAVSYGKIVPQWILDVPRLGALNVHPSLLPLYRGAAPLQAQIRDGVTESGVTIIMMDAGMDTGDVVLQERSTIGERETYGELHDRFAELGADLLGRAIERQARGETSRTPQQTLETEERIAATVTRLLQKDDFKLDAIPPEKFTMKNVVDIIRSSAPKSQEPGGGVEACIAGIHMKILAAHARENGPPISLELKQGVAINGSMFIRALDGWVEIDELREPGSRAVTIEQRKSETLLPQNMSHLGALVRDWHKEAYAKKI